MAVDLNQGYKEVKSNVSALKTFKEAKSNIKSIKSKAADAQAKANKEIANSLDAIKEQKNRLQKEVENQFSQLLGILKSTQGQGPETIKLLQRTIVKTIKKIKPDVEQILVDEIIKLLGCSFQQTYDGEQTLYIKVRSVDFRALLELDPESNVGKVKYEKNKNINISGPKYPFNRQLRKRIEEEGIPYTLQGSSGQDLFDISYTQQDGAGAPGDFFKVTLKNREQVPNKIVEFLRDYYSKISLIETPNIMAELMNTLTGAISIQAGAGIGTIQDNSKFGRLLARILGLCFDNRAEIDVGGTAKIGELDNLDDSFFELTDLDLMAVYQEISNIQNNAIEFEGCDNVTFPVNSFEIVQAIDQLNFVDDNDDDAVINALNNVTETAIQNPNGIGLTVDANFSLSFNFSVISKLPISVIFSLITPKLFLPIVVLFKALSQFRPDLEIDSLEDFAKKYKEFFVGLATKIFALFIRELFKLIKKDIVILLKSLQADLGKAKVSKKAEIILALLALAIQIAKIINDFRQCKSVLDQILALFRIPSLGGSIVPPPLLLFTNLLPGYQVEKAFLNSIKELQSLGLPTGPLPDGSPNLGLIGMYSQLQGQAKELYQNAKSEMFIPAPPPFLGGATYSAKFV